MTDDITHIDSNVFKGQVQGLGWFLTQFPLKFTENNDVDEIVIWEL